MLAAILALTLTIDPSQSSLRYVVTHKLHQVDATSHEVQGKAVTRPDGTAITEVRAPVASFKSGDGNRDEHMLETMNVGSFPYVIFKGLMKLPAGGALPQGAAEMQGQVDFHGVKKPYTVPLTFEPQPDGSVRVKGTFDVSLDAHNVERPSLLFVKIEDACRIEVDLLLRPEK